jgi:molecular chaperone DnaK
MSDMHALKPGFCIGIDLGIAKSIAATAENDGEVELLPNRDGESWTPSVVSFSGKKQGSESGEYLVGTEAILNSGRDPGNTIHSIKRLIGVSFRDAALQESHARLKFEILEDQTRGDVLAVSIGGRLLTPEEITAQIIRRIKNDAEIRLGGPVTRAVITVPAYFTARQSSATRHAGLLAGLCVSAILAARG